MSNFERNPFAQKYKANLKERRTAHSKALDSKNLEGRRKMKTKEIIDKHS